jgi:hypothetical protein
MRFVLLVPCCGVVAGVYPPTLGEQMLQNLWEGTALGASAAPSGGRASAPKTTAEGVSIDESDRDLVQGLVNEAMTFEELALARALAQAAKHRL